MSRIQPVEHESSTGKTRELLDGIAAKFGGVPNLMRTFAQSPAALQFFLSGSQALAGGVIPAKIREQIDLVVSQENGCDYCLAAHTQLARGLRLTDDQIVEARRGRSEDPKTSAILAFASALVECRGRLTEDHFAAARSEGLSDPELAEIIAAVALKIFTNYFAIATEVEVDFPGAPALV
jgi:uncharacterized peroxidase-related enzyme